MKAVALSLLVAILLLAAALRFTALDFGEGRINARPDEDAVSITFHGMETGVLMPPMVIYGGGYFYPLRAFASAWEMVGLPVLKGDRLIPGAWQGRQRHRLRRGPPPAHVHGQRRSGHPATGAAVSAFTLLALNPHWLTNTAQAITIAKTAVGNVTENSWLVGSDEA